MLVSGGNDSHSYSKVIRRGPAGPLDRNRRMEKAKRRAKTPEVETAITEAKTLLGLYNRNV